MSDKRRTKVEVLKARENAVGGGCCNRFADQQACDCLSEATGLDPRETFPRGPSNEQTLLTELGEARRQLAEIKAIDAKMCADYSTMVEELAEAQAERNEARSEVKRLTEIITGWRVEYDHKESVAQEQIKRLTAERDTLAVTAERQAEQIRRMNGSGMTLLEDSVTALTAAKAQIRRLRDWLALALEHTYDMGMTTEDRRKLAEAEVYLRETAP